MIDLKAGYAGFFGKKMYTKKELRQQQKVALMTEPASKREFEEKKLYELLFKKTEWQTAQTIATTLSTDFELNTMPIIAEAWEEKKRVVVPKIINHQMIFVEIDSKTRYQVGKLNIKEPINNSSHPIQDIDLVIVPGLAFTKKGQRLGFGAGYYDKFLQQYSGKTVSLALTTQLVDDLPIEVHDQVVQMVISLSE
ncbi:5-formyltetrahydrofolate cyclo-ligase family protein [Leuconostoc suionicum]|uniref:5-formyltetrahydrofolate cyclo-ligase n=2 Tax=Lactobacillaceae TaxID=33958 RepID=A0A2N9K8X6_9LACO|nr:5-formyltetrahydrofolate cyclo-ligase [Leuconostoc suionicum]SPD91749.1 5-formyltetrahydrofolate cyclo-ligase family protein [Leuconostoc suionicum]SPE07028.1 5-formyltetrahydrofolate cyclo-ligase family protein [Leuconostoc suionicum]SPH03481.1 5-formyltetrahydrofolate cyclo-ligase family protein [Leuconostoc suionicum]